jgi:hypothetical protein
LLFGILYLARIFKQGSPREVPLYRQNLSNEEMMEELQREPPLDDHLYDSGFFDGDYSDSERDDLL